MDSKEKDKREVITNIQYALEEVYLSKILKKHYTNIDKDDN